MKLDVEKRNGKHLCHIELNEDANLDDLKSVFYQNCHYYPERQRWTLPSGKPIDENSKLKDQGVKNGGVIMFKDLGVQISWRLVFVLEYLGPLLIAPIFYMRHKSSHSFTQHVAFILMMFHFLKRELETLFIHRFSHGSMPLIRLPINCAHYWLLCGLAISYYLFHPYYHGPFDTNDAVNRMTIYTLATTMLACEFMNFKCHTVLRALRPRGSKTRNIPYGWGFDQISCANYFWEIGAWTAFCLLVNCLTAWLFLLVATLQMVEWAIKKHRNYLKEFKAYPRSRKAIFPLIL